MERLFVDSYPQPGEIRFRVGSVPVVIQPYFWLTAVILSSGWFNMEPRPWPVFTFILGVFVSILIHELGHAWAGMFFGARHVFIRLTGMGGEAAGANINPQWWKRILVTFAGPAVQLVLAGLLYLLLFHTEFLGKEHPIFAIFIFQLFLVSLLWGLINLIPIFPLDGGRIAQEVLLKTIPSQSEKLSALLSLCLLIGILYYIYNFANQYFSIFNMLILGLLAITNLERLQRATARRDDSADWRN